ncbi:MAG: hypothetical protein V3S07_00310 [Micropepsaceae bacterium]
MADFLIRPASMADAPVIARMLLISPDGLAAYVWSRIAKDGEAVEAVGPRRYGRENTAFSYENCLIAESGGKSAGILHCFEMEQDPSAAHWCPTLSFIIVRAMRF